MSNSAYAEFGILVFSAYAEFLYYLIWHIYQLIWHFGFSAFAKFPNSSSHLLNLLNFVISFVQIYYLISVKLLSHLIAS
ncbi:hypothetical protein V8B55DRAFT_1084072 [Mucor lusitanicus]